MSDMKCPVCNKLMKQATYDYDKKDNDDALYMSIMPCDCVCSYGASKAVWQELIRTRKALDVAIKGLKHIRGTCLSYAADYMDTADNILEQITALEQKDVK